MKRCHNFSLQMKSGNVRSTFCTSAFCSLRRWLLTKRGDARCSAVQWTACWPEFQLRCIRYVRARLLISSPSHWSIYVMLCSGGTIPKVGGFTELSPCTSRWDPFQFPKQQHRCGATTRPLDRSPPPVGSTDLQFDRSNGCAVHNSDDVDRAVAKVLNCTYWTAAPHLEIVIYSSSKCASFIISLPFGDNVVSSMGRLWRVVFLQYLLLLLLRVSVQRSLQWWAIYWSRSNRFVADQPVSQFSNDHLHIFHL